MSTTEIILAEKPNLPPVQISPAALALRDQALAGASLIGKVEDADENTSAVRAHVELKRIASAFERQRKALKEPLLEAGRQLDRVVAKELLEVNKEIGRIENMTSNFQLAEQRRVREEEELQRRELARIEAEKQAELLRIAREQEEVARKAREESEAKQRVLDRIAAEQAKAEQAARDAAAKLAAEAKKKIQRESAERARMEAARVAEENRIAREKQQAEQAAEASRAQSESIARAAEETRRVQEAAQNATAAEAKPITATRAQGQIAKMDWEITVTNPYELAKFHPDCVKIEPLLLPIKQALNSGITVRGIRAERKMKTNVRVDGGSGILEV